MLKIRYLINRLRLLKDLKLAIKFNLILILIFLISFLISGAGLSILLQQKAHSEVTDKVNALSQIMSAISNFPYENNQYIGSTTLKNIFNNFRKNADYQDYYYKQLVLNPTNSQSEKFASQLFEQFTKKSANNTYLSGFQTFSEGESFYIARCVVEANNSSKNNFCFQDKDKNISVQIIYVPASKIFAATRQLWLLTMIMLFAISAIVTMVINLLLKRIIIKPIVQISKVARLVSTGRADIEFEQQSNDELGSLAASFNRMKTSLEIAKQLRKQKKNNNN